MKIRILLISILLGLGLALGLICGLAGPGMAVEAAASIKRASIPAASAPRAPQSPSAELRVCDTCPYTTIQAAVDAATDGDVIKVATGSYTDVHHRGAITQVVYISKSVTIRGGYTAAFTEPPDPDANPTELDAGGQGRVIYIEGDISPTLEGLEITGGDATGLGGGPWSYEGTGGGIYVVSATATISDCWLYLNTASRTGWGGGGGIYLWASPSTLVDNIICSNTASQSTADMGEGGGVALSGSDATLIGNHVRYNTANSAATTMLRGIGGGIYVEAGTSTMRNNLIYGNTASALTAGGGGGIWFGLQDQSLLVNTVLMDNVSGATASSRGSAIASEWSYPRLVHTTLHDNTGGDGSGVNSFFDSKVTLTNTIIVSQTVGVTATSGSTVTLVGVLWHANGTDFGGAGHIALSGQVFGDPAFQADGYHLGSTSQAIDAGVTTVITEDIDGQMRPLGPAPDLGVDEWRAEVTINPDVGGILVYTDTQGLTTTVEIPPGALAQTTTLIYTPVPSSALPVLPGVQYSNRAFDLDGLCYAAHVVHLPLVLRGYPTAAQMPSVASFGDRSLRNIPSSLRPIPCQPSFQVPVTITLHYSDADVAGLNEEDLRLNYWTGTSWGDATTTCITPTAYVTDTAANWLQVPVCHLSRWSLH